VDRLTQAVNLRTEGARKIARRYLSEYKSDRGHWGGFERRLQCGIGDRSCLSMCPGRGRFPSGSSHPCWTCPACGFDPSPGRPLS